MRVAVDAVLQGRPVADQMKPETGPLTVCPNSWRRQPDLGHEIPACQLGQHTSVNLVGLGGQGCDAFGLDRVSDRHVPAGELELIVDEA
jgi:hypothetical protein